jgi:hypothetical protein
MPPYKQNDLAAWKGDNGILNHGQEYRIDKVRDGKRGQEFTLKYRDGNKVKDPADGSIIWWEAGSPFFKRQKEAPK